MGMVKLTITTLIIKVSTDTKRPLKNFAIILVLDQSDYINVLYSYI